MGLRVRTLFLTLFLLVLLVPFVVLGVLRLFEEALIRETEEVLLSEAVVIGEVYRQQVAPVRALPEPTDDALRFAPFVPKLELSGPILPPAKRGPTTTTVAPGNLDLMLERVIVRNLSGVRVVDRNGLVVASGQGERGYRVDHLPEVQAALHGDYRPVLRRRYSDEAAPPVSALSRAAALRVSIAIPVFANPRAPVGGKAQVLGAVYASRTPLDPRKALWQWRQKLILPVLVSIVVTLAIAVLLSVTIAGPLVRLRHFAEAVAQGKTIRAAAPDRTAPLEIAALSKAIGEMKAQLESRAHYIREFAANTAHELKTPLTSIRGASELLLEDWERMTPQQRQRFLSNIRDDSVRMNGLVGRILELARIEAAPPKKEPTDLAAFLEGITERYRRAGHELRLQLLAKPRAIAMAPESLEMLFSNLLDNAVRHGAGQPVEVTVKDLPMGRIIEVRDRGPKLPEGHLDRAFERFYSTERHRGGTGLGLAIVKAIVEAHGGKIEAEALDEGACFTLWFPD